MNLSEGRLGGVVEEYWKKMMKDELLFELIKDFFNNLFRIG